MNSEPAAPTTQRSRRAATPVTFIILGVTVLIFFLQELTRSGTFLRPFLELNQAILGNAVFQALLEAGWGRDPLVMLGGKITPLILMGQVWRFFTPALLHGDLMHLGFNMYALFAIGSSVESYYGSRRYLALYILGAFGGSVLSFLLSPGVSVGASGAIFALIGAEAVFVYQNRSLLGPRARAMLMNSLFIIVINLFFGFTSQTIDNWGHLGGLFAGLAFGWFGGPVMSWQMSGFGSYGLSDVRSSLQVWLAWWVVAALFAGLAFLGFTVLLA